MADVTDPHAIKFGNEQIRSLCDRIPTFYAILKQHASLFQDTPGLAAAFPNDATAAVADGSPGDGRRPYTSADVVAFEGLVAGFVSQLEANNRAAISLALKMAVNPAIQGL